MKMILKEDGKPGDKVSPVGSLGSLVLRESFPLWSSQVFHSDDRKRVYYEQSTSKKSQRTTQLNPVLVLLGQGHHTVKVRTINYFLPSVLTV